MSQLTDQRPEPIVLTRFEELREAYRAKDLRQSGYDEGAVVTADTLLDLHGTAHRDRRRLENRLFRRETFRYYEREVLPPCIVHMIRMRPSSSVRPKPTRKGCSCAMVLATAHWEPMNRRVPRLRIAECSTCKVTTGPAARRRSEPQRS